MTAVLLFVAEKQAGNSLMQSVEGSIVNTVDREVPGKSNGDRGSVPGRSKHAGKTGSASKTWLPGIKKAPKRGFFYA